MAVYPIRIIVEMYHGKKESLRQECLRKIELAKVVEKYINDKVKESPHNSLVTRPPKIGPHIMLGSGGKNFRRRHIMYTIRVVFS